MWRFQKAEKKGEAEADALYASRCDVFQKMFRYHQWKKKKKGDAGATALNRGKRKGTALPSWQTGQQWLLVKRK